MAGSNGYISKSGGIVIGNTSYAAINRRIDTCTQSQQTLPTTYCDNHYLVLEQCFGSDESAYCNQKIIPGINCALGPTGYAVLNNGSNGVTTLYPQFAGLMLKYSATYDSCCCPYCTYCCVYYSGMCLTTDAVNLITPSSNLYTKFTLSRAPYTVYFCNTCTGKTCLGTMAGNTCGGSVVTNVNALTLADTSVCAQGNNYIIVCCGGNIGANTTGSGSSTGGVANLSCADCQIAIFGLSKSNTSNACCCCSFGTNYII